jgi:hypothetical protein
MRLKVLFLTALLTGCANAPIYLAKMTPQELRTVPMHNLCFAYAFNEQSTVLDELRRRNEFSPADMALVQSHNVEVGMHRRAAECVLAKNTGVPLTHGLEPGVTKIEYRYVGTALFVRDDIVTSIQHF